MSLKRKEDGFTGLEAAIVLIAFIVVAAVFSYVMLGAGFFTTQKSQETVFGAVGQATANMEVSGPVILYSTSGSTDVTWMSFTVVLAAGGQPMDTDKFTFVVSTADYYKEHDSAKTDTAISYIWYPSPKTGDFLERGDILEIKITGASATAVKPNKPFAIEVKPAQGASLPINRHAPLSFAEPARYYEVY